jgi:hypothetical protein
MHVGGLLVVSQRSPGALQGGVHVLGPLHAGGFALSSQVWPAGQASAHVAMHVGGLLVVLQRRPWVHAGSH